MTTRSSTVKFLKYDAYGNPCFTSTAELDKDTYEELKITGEKLETMFPYQFNPLYHSEVYNSVNIRFDKDDTLNKRLVKDAVYTIKWAAKTRQKQNNGERYAIVRMTGRPLFVRMEESTEEDLEI